MYEINLKNENLDQDTSAFPEPPLTVRRRSDGHACVIDGGIWARDGFRFIRNESFLITHEYSGSSDELVVYRTADCAPVTRVPLPERAWSATDDTITIGHSCSGEGLAKCRSRTTVKIGAR